MCVATTAPSVRPPGGKVVQAKSRYIMTLATAVVSLALHLDSLIAKITLGFTSSLTETRTFVVRPQTVPAQTCGLEVTTKAWFPYDRSRSPDRLNH